jgi:hypothetical protein
MEKNSPVAGTWAETIPGGPSISHRAAHAPTLMALLPPPCGPARPGIKTSAWSEAETDVWATSVSFISSTGSHDNRGWDHRSARTPHLARFLHGFRQQKKNWSRFDRHGQTIAGRTPRTPSPVHGPTAEISSQYQIEASFNKRHRIPWWSIGDCFDWNLPGIGYPHYYINRIPPWLSIVSYSIETMGAVAVRTWRRLPPLSSIPSVGLGVQEWYRRTQNLVVTSVRRVGDCAMRNASPYSGVSTAVRALPRCPVASLGARWKLELHRWRLVLWPWRIAGATRTCWWRLQGGCPADGRITATGCGGRRRSCGRPIWSVWIRLEQV